MTSSKSKKIKRTKKEPVQKSDFLNVAVVQMTSVDDVSRNVQAINDVLDELLLYASGERHVDLIVFPENCLFLRTNTFGQEIQTFDLKESIWAEFQKRSDRLNSHLIFGSVPLSTAKKSKSTGKKSAKGKVSKPTNSMVMVSPKGRGPQVIYSKIHLFDVDVVGAPIARESDSFRHGQRPAMIEVAGWKIGLSICYDVRFSELYQYYARKSVDMILVPSAFLVPTGQAHWHTLLRARAIECQAYVLAPAQSGGHVGSDQSVRNTYGHSLVIGPWGQIIDEALESGPRTLISRLSLDEIKKVRSQIPMTMHRRLK